MPEIDQYSFTNKEVAEALVKQAGLHDGRWQLLAHFTFAAANVGSAKGPMPTGFVAIEKMGLIKARPDSPAELVVDAAEVNPAST